jgi:hypothetical protein
LDAPGSDSLARLEVGESHVSASSPWGVAGIDCLC